MKRSQITLLALPLITIISAGCSGRGDDVVDPNSGLRSQAAIVSLVGGEGDELGIYTEESGLRSSHAWLDANGSPLARRVDAVQEAFDRLYLLHRESGSITIADLRTRVRIAELTGFPSGIDSGLIDIAFSNLSQGWAIAYGRPSIFHIDLVNEVVVAELPLPGLPTAVATSGNRVFVATESPGGGVVSVFRSNQQGHPIENSLPFPAPVIFMAENGAADAVAVVTAGNSSRAPAVHSIKLPTLEQAGEKELSSAPLTRRIGRAAEFAAATRDNYLYVALDDVVVRVDIRSGRLPVSNWLRGTFEALDADYWSDLMYAVEANGTSAYRVGSDGTELGPVDFPAPVRALEFVNSTKVGS